VEQVVLQVQAELQVTQRLLTIITTHGLLRQQEPQEQFKVTLV
jgi:hypothetical protein